MKLVIVKILYPEYDADITVKLRFQIKHIDSSRKYNGQAKIFVKYFFFLYAKWWNPLAFRWLPWDLASAVFYTTMNPYFTSHALTNTVGYLKRRWN